MPRGIPKDTTKRSSHACTACRQVKARCDTAETFPDPCSRCKQKARRCVFDPSFKRTRARGQIERMSRQVADLQEALGRIQQDGVVSSASHDATPEIQADSGSDGTAFGTSAEPSPNNTISYELGGVTLPSSRANRLFSFFSKHMYPYLPIIDPSLAYDEFSKTVPFLFWTIIMITSRYVKDDPSLEAQLRTPYQRYLGKVLRTAPMSLQSVQALLFLCMWPLAVESQALDPGWNISAITVAACFRPGLGNSRLPASEWDLRTWLACFYVNTTLSSMMGTAPLIRSPEELSAIAIALERGSLPLDLSARIELQRQVARFHMLALADSSQAPSFLFVSVLEQDIDFVRTKYDSIWNDELEIALQHAKLVVCASTMVSLNKILSQSTPSPSDHWTLYQLTASRALQSACSLIATFNIFLERLSASLEYPSQPYAFPKRHYDGLIMASFFLPHYLNSERLGTQKDKVTIKRHLRLAQAIAKTCSREAGDEADRVAAVLEIVHSNPLPSEMQIDNRQAASVTYDTMRKVGKLRGRLSYADQPTQQVMPDRLEQSSPSQLSADATDPIWDAGLALFGNGMGAFGQNWSNIFTDGFEGLSTTNGGFRLPSLEHYGT